MVLYLRKVAILSNCDLSTFHVEKFPPHFGLAGLVKPSVREVSVTGVGGTAQLSRVAVVETGPVPGHRTYPQSHLSGDFSHACYTVSQSILVAGGRYLPIFLMGPLSSREERAQDHSA